MFSPERIAQPLLDTLEPWSDRRTFTPTSLLTHEVYT